MANTIIETDRTIQVSEIDSDYMMPGHLNVDTVVFIPGAAGDFVPIIENSDLPVDPITVELKSGDGEPRGWPMGKQRLRLGFTFLEGVFSVGSSVIFNIGERGY